MKEKINTKELLGNASITEVIGRHVTLKREGPEMVGICPFHQDAHSSLKVNEKKGMFKCFACGAGGDAINFLTRMGASFHEACAEIEGTATLSNLTPEQRASNAKKYTDEWMQVKPVPAGAGDPPKHYRYGKPSARWEYRDYNSALIGYVCRFDLPDGKQVLPLVFATDGARSEWRWHGFDKPRPLWNLPEILEHPGKTVVIFEGEKTAEAGQRLLPDYVSTTWIGGARAIKHTDWTPLAKRRVIFWPDNDKEFKYPEGHEKAGELLPYLEQPSNAAMLDIFNLLKDQCPGARWMENPEDAKNKWDIADADWTPEQAVDFLKTHQVDPYTWQRVIDRANRKKHTATPTDPAALPFWVKALLQAEPAPEPTPDPDQAEITQTIPEMQADAKERQKKTAKGKTKTSQNDGEAGSDPNMVEPPFVSTVILNEPEYKGFFKFLGYDKNDTGVQAFYFFSFAANTSIRLTAGQMSTNTLMTLAPLDFWQHYFPGKTAGDIGLQRAIDWVIQSSNRAGIFAVKMVRGRGAWIDDNRVVIHSGDHLLVDKRKWRLGKFKTKYVYEQAEPLEIHVGDEATKEESAKVLEIFGLLNWEREINAKLLAGWCVVAPVCGALKWRPHIWITGAAGCGKSWMFQHLVRPVLGKTCLAVQSQTSEAGLRQTLQNDALPVVFDEAEGEDKRSQDRMQSVLGLMRASSTDDGGIMAKGTAGGMSRTFRIRSCFAFASIGMQIAHQSDRTRVTVLGLKMLPASNPQKEIRWKALQEKRGQFLTDEFIDKLHSRTIRLLPTIIKSAEVFAAAITNVIGDARSGDQLSYLLAGAWSLQSDDVVTYEQAEIFTAKADWDEENGLKETKDELECFQHLMEQITRTETSLGPLERNIGELIGIAANLKSDQILPEDANNRLKRLGFRLSDDEQGIVISNTAQFVTAALAKTAWAKNHNKILMRIIGAQAITSARFGSGVPTRAVRIPINMLHFKDSPEPEKQPLPGEVPTASQMAIPIHYHGSLDDRMKIA